MAQVSPSENQLASSIKALREAHPDLGIVKLWTQLKADKPDWTVSEKRFRKVLSESVGGSGGNKDELVAKTGIDPTLDIDNVAPSVKAKMFGGTRGKGLVAKDKIEKGQVLWQEEPWIACPDPSLIPHLVSKRFCTHCLAQFKEPNPPLSVECPTCSKAHFCNRLCLSKARPQASHHDLLCEGNNFAAKEINNLVQTREWRSLDVVARIVARWRGERAWGQPGSAKDIENRVWGSIARVNMEKRESQNPNWAKTKDFYVTQWKAGHEALVHALNPAPTDSNYKSFQSLLKSHAKRGRKLEPLTAEEEARWFSYESFLELLGMVNINLEDSGGMYALHAHMNHSCEPSIQVRNLPKTFVAPTELPADLPARNPPGVRGTHKLTMLARRTIPKGEELSISYVNLEMPRDQRRTELRQGYGFWCECVRCKREEKEEKDRKGENGKAVAA